MNSLLCSCWGLSASPTPTRNLLYELVRSFLASRGPKEINVERSRERDSCEAKWKLSRQISFAFLIYSKTRIRDLMDILVVNKQRQGSLVRLFVYPPRRSMDEEVHCRTMGLKQVLKWFGFLLSKENSTKHETSNVFFSTQNCLRKCFVRPGGL